MIEDHTAEREAFEAWYSAEDQETDDPERTYELTEEGMNELTRYCVWQGWQARAAAQDAGRKPLTAVAAMRLVMDVDMQGCYVRGTTNWAVAITRAIEYAHGITAQQGSK